MIVPMFLLLWSGDGYQPLCLCPPPPPSSPANCTNMIRACETALSQIFPFPLTPTYLKPFLCGCWDSPLLCLHPRRPDRSLSRISQLPKPRLLRFHCLRMSWQRRIMTGLENQILASLYVVFSDPLPAFKCRYGEFRPLG